MACGEPVAFCLGLSSPNQLICKLGFGGMGFLRQ